MKNLDTNIIDTINYLENSALILSKPGNYEIWACYQEQIIKKSIQIKRVILLVVNQLVDQILKNKFFLNSISNRYNGFYTDIYKFSDRWLYKIQNKKISENNKKIYTALEIFIKEKIFILVLILFCFEIYLRKKNGLL